MKRISNLPVPLVLLLAFRVTIAAQDDVATAASSAEVEEVEEVEEITVYGEKSVSALRYAVYRAQENFYEIFSALNDDDEFDVRCFYETPSGTRLRTHVCRARFVTDAHSAYAARWRTEGPRSPLRDPTAVIAQKSTILRERMEAMIAADPKLQDALDRYTVAQSRYKAERERH